MAPVVTRQLRITYGSTVVGGTSDYQIDAGDDGQDRMVIDRTFEATVVEFYVLTADHADDAAFATAVAALELAFTRPRLRLLIEQGTLAGTPSTLLDLNPATDSGIDVTATIRKAGSPHDTGRSRRYFVRITSGNPANQSATITGEAGLRSFRSRIRFLPSRLGLLDVEGTYTKLASSTAQAQYIAQIDARVGAITTVLGGTWDLVEEERRPNLEGSLVEFNRSYEELNLAQGVSTVDDPNVARQRLNVTIGEEAPGDAGGALRLVTVAVSYEAWINKTVTDLPTWWASYGLPWVVAHARATVQAAGMALVARDVTPDKGLNFIRARLVFLAATGGAVLSRDVATEDYDIKGKRFVPVWNGNPLAAYVFQGPREVYRTITVTQRVLGNVTPSNPGGGGARARAGNIFGIGNGGNLALDFGAGAGIFGIGQELSLEFLGPGEGGAGSAGSSGLGPAPGVTAFELVETKDRYAPKVLGLAPYRIEVTDVTRMTLSRLVTGVPANTQSGGGGGGSRGGGTRARPAGAA